MPFTRKKIEISKNTQKQNESVYTNVIIALIVTSSSFPKFTGKEMSF